MTTEIIKFANFTYLRNSNQWTVVYPEVIFLLVRRHCDSVYSGLITEAHSTYSSHNVQGLISACLSPYTIDCQKQQHVPIILLMDNHSWMLSFLHFCSASSFLHHIVYTSSHSNCEYCWIIYCFHSGWYCLLFSSQFPPVSLLWLRKYSIG